MLRTRFLLFIFGLAVSSVASAQDQCSEVLKYTGRSDIAEAESFSFANRLYSQHCEGQAYKENKNLNIGIDAVVEAVPVSFKLGSGSNVDKANHFCKTYDEYLSQNYARAIQSSIVSTDAVQAWESCQRFRNVGVFFAPAIRTDSVTVSVEKKGANPITVQGVRFDAKKLECQVTGDDAKPTEPSNATLATRRTLNTGDQWQVTCARLGNSQTTEVQYPQATLSILTTAGSFDLPVPPDAEIGPQSASTLNENVKLLQAEIVDLAKRRLECVSTTADSAWDRSPTIAARSADYIAAGYVLAGGGCTLAGAEPGSPGGRAHNGPITSSTPTPERDGWSCRAMDPPNIPLAYSVQAHAIFCRVQ